MNQSRPDALFEPLRAFIRSRGLRGRIGRLERLTYDLQAEVGRLHRSVFVPDAASLTSDVAAPFMPFANCQAADIAHPRYRALCKLLAATPVFHRKQWEWVFILHKLMEAGALREGARGLGFGVGTEPLPAAFATFGAVITATDAPFDVDGVASWVETNQHSSGIEALLRPAIAPDALVRARVTHRSADMNAIADDLTGYDFNWSSCCFEHLGSIEHGLQFVVNAVEKTLKIGGVAVHTTELNMSSNDDTVDSGDTVLFRLRDLDDLLRRLRERGHTVDDLVLGPAAHALDFHVDVPPYAHNPHLKLLLAGYVTTSVGVVVRRGR